MLSTLRKTRLGQVAFAIASLLAITGSLGLHPEPVLPAAAAAPAGFVAHHGPQASDGLRHECLACLAHRAVSLPRLSGVVLEPGAAVALFLPPRAGRPLAADTRTHEGRAPPALA